MKIISSDAMLRRAPEALLGLGAVAFLAVAVWTLWPDPAPGRRIPPKEQTSIDSLAATRPDYRRRVDTLVTHETTYVAVARQNRAQSIETARRADSLRRVAIAADSASQAARDTSTLWRRAAEVWRATADTLGAATVRLAVAYAAESTARVAADARADETARRTMALESLNARLTRDLQQRLAPCRIAWVLECPSRKAVYVAGLLTPSALRVARNLVVGKPPLGGVF